MRLGIGISSALAALVVAVAPGMAAAREPAVTEFNTGLTLAIGAWDLAPVDDELWLTQDVFSTLGRVDMSGGVTDLVDSLLLRGGPRGMTAGPDGNVWVAESGGTGAIARVEPDGTVTEFDTGLTAGDPWDITVAKDGNLWFVNRDPAVIGRIELDGTITEFTTGLTPNSRPSAITTGPDGDVWFVQSATGRIGVLCVDDGTITEFDTGLTASEALTDITAGPDGKLWFTLNGDPGGIGKMTTSGSVTVFTNGLTPNSRPVGIAEGSDGALWFTESAGSGAIGRITTSGQIEEFTDGLTPGMAPWMIAPGPDGNMWFTENGLLGRVARISLPPVVRSMTAIAITRTSATLRAKLQANSQDTDYWFEYGPSTSYGEVTGTGPLAGGASLQLVQKDLEDLEPGTEYHFRLVAANDSGTSYGPDRTFTTLPLPTVEPAGDEPEPEPKEKEKEKEKEPKKEREPDFARTIVAEPAGTVKVKAPGGGWQTMEPGEETPVGATFDTRRGAVSLTSAGCRGREQTGRFGGGVFTLRQPRQACGRVDIYLRGGSFRSCRPAGRRAGGHGSLASASSSRRVRRLWGRDKGGRYRTHGRNSQATVRGTRWVTVDRCDGTFTRVTEGAVSVRDKVRHRTVLVRAGHSYLAKSRATLRREQRRARRHRHQR